ncbi:unnamed protein product [Didymodactylos carnosus]|uniref:Tesmin/TSO1-like CXC domain-containing protein n=1 Tax=Didymodactylos carnosus TaxID=1234261 RepID=A0A815NLA7_9BILA|nr:unnamed protein product [Didymodactylos carnosus]CAF1433603.1 unnamed protein product [Didymodactylos carnosus]CAF3864548.1 unnamed protein product [Didymodactylos carnosus]CAF4311636.1 unnamed protein product [Didymodactylos carnosus]
MAFGAFPLSEAARHAAEKLIISCYDSAARTLNETRVFCAKKFIQGISTKSLLDRLPPTDDVFQYHIARANVQINIWMQACESNMYYPDLKGNGYEEVDGELVIKWKNLESYPKLTGCKCKKNCKNCGCKQSLCTFLCKCDPQKCVRRTSDTTQQQQAQAQAAFYHRHVATRVRFLWNTMLIDDEDSDDDGTIDQRTVEENVSGNDGDDSSEYEYLNSDNESCAYELYGKLRTDKTNSYEDENEDLYF